MTPPQALVRALAAHDPKLRLRWWPTSAEWVIEEPVPPRDPDILRTLQRDHVEAVERMRGRLRLAIPGSPSHQATGRQIDAVQAALAGYRAIVFIPAALATQTDLVLEALRDSDLAHRPTVEDFNREMDETAATVAREKDKERRRFAEDGARDVYERIQWLLGNRLAMSDFADGAETSDAITEHPGFTVRIRKGMHARAAS
jgi:hypothetical protein